MSFMKKIGIVVLTLIAVLVGMYAGAYIWLLFTGEWVLTGFLTVTTIFASAMTAYFGIEIGESPTKKGG